eukprot:SAG22_NODE_2843_length_2162_cov_1.319922_2_plen_656_part_01
MAGFKVYYETAATISSPSTLSPASSLLGYIGSAPAGTISGLSGGTLYRFAVTTLSDSGESQLGTAVLQSTAPPQVTTVSSMSQTSSTIRLQWDAPTIGSGDPVEQFAVYRSQSSDMHFIGSTAETNLVVTDLVGASSYSFSIVCVNNAGESDPSIPFEQSTSPGAPSGLTSSVPTTSSITLEWSAPAELGGDAVTEYVLHMDDGSGESAAVSTEAYRGADLSVSDSGEGDRSEVVTQSTAPAAAGAAPESDASTASSIDLSWTAPSVSTGLAATGYRVYDVTGGADSGVLVYDGAASSATEAVVSDLASGTLYTYVVSALSDAGEGDVSASVEVSTAPGVVTGVANTGQTSSSITLEWTAPVVTTGSEVTGYKVYEHVVTSISDLFAADVDDRAVFSNFFANGGEDIVQRVLVFDGSSATASTTLSGLRAGSAYQLSVVASSAAGDGVHSSVLTTSVCPPQPTGLGSTDQSAHTIALNWEEPTVSTGAAVTGYIVYRNDGAGGAELSTEACDGRGSLDTSCSVSGLSGGQEYVFAVSAESVVGEGDRSSTVSVSTAPTYVTGVLSDAQTSTSISLTWQPPTTGRDDSVSGYRVYRDDGDGSHEHDVLAYDGSASTTTAATISGLEGGRMYSFDIFAISPSGAGARSYAFNQSTSPC